MDNLEPQPVQKNASKSSTPLKPAHKPPIIVILIFLVIICFIAFWSYTLGQKSRKITGKNIAKISPSISPTPATTSGTDETAKWKEYSFSFANLILKVPGDLTVEEGKRELPGDAFTLYIQDSPINTPMKSFQMYVLLNTDSKTTNSSETLSVSEFDPLSVKRITIGGFPATQGQYKGQRNNYITIIQTKYGLFTISTSPSTTENKKLSDKILSTFTFSDKNNAVNYHLKTFTSNTLGISFTYLDTQGNGAIGESAQIVTKEVGNKVYVYVDNQTYEKGQSVEVIEKSPNDSLEDAIKKKFLSNIPPQDCFISHDYPYEKKNLSQNYEIAIISFPKVYDPDLPWWTNASKCPENYTTSNGVAYFLYNKEIPNKYLFFTIGQYPIMTEGSKSWQDSIQIY